MRETITRLLSGIVYILLLAAAIFYTAESFMLLFGVFLMIAVVEFCSLVGLNKNIPIIVAACCYFLFAIFPWIYTANDLDPAGVYRDYLLTSLFLLAATLFVSVKCLVFLFDDKARIGDKATKYTYLIGYIVLPFILLVKIPFQGNGSYYTPEVIFGMFILIWTNDTCAFIVGKTMGKNKLYPKVSPKKTVEGFVGGLGFTLVAAAVMSRFSDQGFYFWVIVAVIVSVIGTAGDLIESKFKRMAGVKDSGNIMPGHGGILDRLDSVIFAAPFVFLFYQILYYVS
jgi:phosphatidate cytidylyltransferase